MEQHQMTNNKSPNKTDKGNGSYGICRVIDASRSPSPASESFGKNTSRLILILVAFAVWNPLVSYAEPESPKYYECIEPDAFNAVVLFPDGKARFLWVQHNKDKTTWFYFDESATWGIHEGPSPIWKQMKHAPFIWVKTYDKDGARRYRYDYYQLPDKLVEYDKTGIQRELTKRINMANVLKWK